MRGAPTPRDAPHPRPPEPAVTSASDRPAAVPDRVAAPADPPAAELQACVRDLLSLIALPALTLGSDPRDILSRFAEALGSLLPIRFCIISAAVVEDDDPISLWRADGGSIASPDAEWTAYAASWTRSQRSQLAVSEESTPAGTLRVARLAMGYSQHTGVLSVGSDDPTFPSLTQGALLRAASSLAAGRLKAARLVHEREEASRVKDEFLAMLGHELRNPLAPIVTALDLMRLRGDGSTAREQQIIRRQVDHLVRLVDDLMDVSRITRGKVELRQQTVEISAVLGNAVEMASLLLEQRGHRLHIDAPEAGLCWTGDPTRLAQVVANLLTNAARYTGPGGDIRLTARREANTAVISVRDNGIGMSAELLPRVFDMFRQGPRTLDRGEGGLGLGLALVKNLVQMHGGQVEASSDGPGHGSEFVVRLPLVVERGRGAAPPQAGVEAAAATRPLRILVVDDNADGADVMGAVLESHGHRVLVSHDPVNALKVCVGFAPQLALLDIGMPVMDGYELAQRLRKLPGMHALQLVALTGYGRARDLQQSRAAGFAEHLVKPIQPLELLELVARIGQRSDPAEAASA